VPDVSCVAVAVTLGDGQMAAVSAVVAGMRPPLGLLTATRATGGPGRGPIGPMVLTPTQGGTERPVIGPMSISGRGNPATPVPSSSHRLFIGYVRESTMASKNR
jgi:hypothetical protein